MAFVMPQSIQLSSFEDSLKRMHENNADIQQKYKDKNMNEDISNLQILPELTMVK